MLDAFLGVDRRVWNIHWVLPLNPSPTFEHTLIILVQVERDLILL